jgi:hypothetical protein
MTSQQLAALPTGTILDRAVCISLTFSRFGITKQLPKSAYQVDADKDRTKAQKFILDAKELKAIVSLDGEISRWVRDEIALPSPMFKGGIFLVPNELVGVIEKKLAEYRAKRDLLVRAFVDGYPKMIEDSKKALNGQFNPLDYPAVGAIGNEFSMEWMYVGFGVPGQLESVSREIFEREQKKAEERVADATDQIIATLRFSLKQLIDHTVERLTPDADGKQKKYSYTLVENLNDFLATVKQRNITGDVQLDELADKAKEIMNGVDVKTLRDNASVRSYVLKGMETLKSSMDALVTTKTRFVRE